MYRAIVSNLVTLKLAISRVNRSLRPIEANLKGLNGWVNTLFKIR